MTQLCIVLGTSSDVMATLPAERTRRNSCWSVLFSPSYPLCFWTTRKPFHEWWQNGLGRDIFDIHHADPFRIHQLKSSNAPLFNAERWNRDSRSECCTACVNAWDSKILKHSARAFMKIQIHLSLCSPIHARLDLISPPENDGTFETSPKFGVVNNRRERVWLDVVWVHVFINHSSFPKEYIHLLNGLHEESKWWICSLFEQPCVG